eukprot:gene10703-10860_t
MVKGKKSSEDGAAANDDGLGPSSVPEDPLTGFFSQFGKLSKVRLSRSKKTAKPKHYAFLEFAHPDKLSCRVLRKSEIHPQLFKGANRKFKKMPWKKLDADRVNKERTPEEVARRTAALIKRDNSRRRRIAAAGFEYEYEPLAEQQPAKAKKIKFSDS